MSRWLRCQTLLGQGAKSVSKSSAGLSMRPSDEDYECHIISNIKQLHSSKIVFGHMDAKYSVHMRKQATERRARTLRFCTPH